MPNLILTRSLQNRTCLCRYFRNTHNKSPLRTATIQVNAICKPTKEETCEIPIRNLLHAVIQTSEALFMEFCKLRVSEFTVMLDDLGFVILHFINQNTHLLGKKRRAVPIAV